MKIIRILQYQIIILGLLLYPQVSLKADKKTNAINYRHEMRKFVSLISKQAKKINPNFLIIPQNALELLTYNGTPDGKPVISYISQIDGVGCEELFFGTGKDGNRTPSITSNYHSKYLLMLAKYDKKTLIIDYVADEVQAFCSYVCANNHGFISFQGERSLSIIKRYGFNQHDASINKLQKARNFLCYINAGEFNGVENYIKSIRTTRWDLLIIDPFFCEKLLLKNHVKSLQMKPSGNRRLVIAYLSIGEAEDYRYYWKKGWSKHPPSFLCSENPEWKGNYKVKYWMDEWKKIISGKDNGEGIGKSYLKMILDAGFDGVYLDVVDAALYFEENNE